MFSIRPKVYLLLILGLLSLGLGASQALLEKNQGIKAEAAETSSFTFTVVGDTHAGIDPNEFPKYHEWANYNHRGAIEMMSSLNPDFYLHLGDVVHEPTNLAWNEFFNIESSLISSKPIYPTIGNHENYTEDKSFFNKFRTYSHLSTLLTNSARPWYSFDWGNTHFVSLRLDYDNYYPQGEACRPDSPQYQWLENDLKSTDKPWKIVFFHVQIYSLTSDSSLERKEMRGYLHPLFKQYGVDVVFGGHDHYYERVEKDGIVYIESGGGDNRRDPSNPIPQSKKSSEKNHIVKVTINGGQLTGTAISTRSKGKGWTDPGGATLDTFILTKQIQPTATPTPTPTLTPTPTPRPSFNLNSGWNQLSWRSGLPSYTAKSSLEDINQDCGSGTGLILARKNQDFWEEFIQNYGGLNFNLQSNQIYFFKVSKNCTWTP